MQLDSSDLCGSNHKQQILSWLIGINSKPQAIFTEYINNDFFRSIFEINSNLLYEITPIEIELPFSSIEMDGWSPKPSGIRVDGRIGVHTRIWQRGRSLHVSVRLYLLNHVVFFSSYARSGFSFWHYFTKSVDHETVVVCITALLRLNIRD